MKHVTWITALIATLAFNASIGASDQTQSEMNEEACGKYKKADAELNRVYQKVMRDYAGDKNGSSGIAVGRPNIFGSMNRNHLKHSHVYSD